jgi:hypothetical protein
MPDYSKSIIYKLCCKDVNVKEIYIGSTINFKRRKCCHKSSCNNINSKKYNLKVYKYIRANGGFQNWDMIIIEKYQECNDKLELKQRERYYVELLQSSLNMCIPSRTIKEYKQDNKEKIKEKDKQYYINNKEQIKEHQKKYKQDNKDKIKEKDKQYYQDNKEKIKEHKKQYREDNKDKIKAYQKEKVKCAICNKEMRRDSLSRHKKRLHNKV